MSVCVCVFGCVSTREMCVCAECVRVCAECVRVCLLSAYACERAYTLLAHLSLKGGQGMLCSGSHVQHALRHTVCAVRTMLQGCSLTCVCVCDCVCMSARVCVYVIVCV